MRRLLVVSAALTFVLALGRTAAAAADTGWLSMTEPNPYTGPCPATLHFTGHIDGAAGSSVTYHFGSYAASAWVYTNLQTQNIPGNGSLPIASTLSVDTSRAGFQSYEVIISSPSGSDTTTHGKIYLTVTCQAPGSTPSPGSGSKLPSSHRVGNFGPFAVPNAPTGLINTTNPNTCSAHALLFLCNAAIQDKRLVLIWNWSPSDDFKSVNRFKVYLTQFGKRTVTDTIDADPNADLSQVQRASFIKLNLFNPIYDYGKCWVVTAVSGDKESRDSGRFCISEVLGPATASTVLLRPLHSKVQYWDKVKFTLVSGRFGCYNLCAGFEYQSGKDVQGDAYDNGYWRTAVMFDIYDLHATAIFKATLRLHTQFSGGSCLRQIGFGKWNWWDFGTLEGDFSDHFDVPAMPGHDLNFDITPLARQWITSRNNYGLILSGGDENLDAFTNSACIDQYDTAPLLSITYS